MAKGLNPLNLETSSSLWSWHIRATPRILFFIWLFFHKSILTCKVLGWNSLFQIGLSTMAPIVAQERLHFRIGIVDPKSTKDVLCINKGTVFFVIALNPKHNQIWRKGVDTQ